VCGCPVWGDCVRDDLNASGVYGDFTTDRSIALTINRSGFVVGQRYLLSRLAGIG
jgi:hypothetical protein